MLVSSSACMARSTCACARRLTQHKRQQVKADRRVSAGGDTMMDNHLLLRRQSAETPLLPAPSLLM